MQVGHMAQGNGDVDDTGDEGFLTSVEHVHCGIVMHDGGAGTQDSIGDT
jgi:hypothetical protein